MELRLKRKYLVYTEKSQYGFGRKGNGNGKRVRPFARPSNRASGENFPPKTMLVDGATGHKVMVVTPS